MNKTTAIDRLLHSKAGPRRAGPGTRTFAEIVTGPDYFHQKGLY